MLRSRAKSSTGLPVLLIGEVGIEFLDADGGYHHSAVELEAGAGAAEQAAAFVRSIGAEPGPCVLALSAPLVTERTLGLADLPPKELKAVLARKAAGLLESEVENTFYLAHALLHEAGEKEQKWLFHAVRRKPYLALRYTLRAAGFEVRDVVTERMSLAAKMIGGTSDKDDDATVCVAFESNSVAVHLAHDGELVHQTVLSTRFEDAVAMAKVLVQELRGIDAFWRRKSRGAAVSRLALFGFPPAWAERLELTAHAALPGIELVSLEGAAESNMEEARAAALAACRESSKLQVSLDLPLKPRKSTVVAAGLGSLALAIGSVIGSLDHVRAQREESESERASLQARAHDLEGLRVQRQEVTRALGDMALERARIQRIADMGLPADRVLREIFAVFEGAGALLSISLGDGETGREVAIHGQLPARPLDTQRAIDAVLARAEQAPLLQDLEIETRDATRSRGDLIDFSATAWIGGAQ